MICKNRSRTDTTSDTKYLHKDPPLGSIVVVTSASGGLLERLSFDAFGLRRNANGTDATAAITSSVGRVTLANDMPSAYRMLFGGLQPHLFIKKSKPGRSEASP